MNKPKLKHAIDLLESMIMDFEKLGPMTGGATKALAELYRPKVEALKTKDPMRN